MSDTLRTLSVLVSAFFTGVGVTAVALGYLLGSFTVGSIGGALVLASLVLVLVASWYNRAQAEPKIDIEDEWYPPQFSRDDWGIDTPIIPADTPKREEQTPEAMEWSKRQYTHHLCGCLAVIDTPVTTADTPRGWEHTPEGIAMYREVWATRCPKCSAL